MWPSTSWPLSSFTRNIVLGRASVTSPSISIFSSFGNCSPLAGPAGRRPSLDPLDVDRLRALVAGFLLVGNLGVLLQRLEPVAADARVMDEQVAIALVRSDEPVALLVVEPLHGPGRHAPSTFLSANRTATRFSYGRRVLRRRGKKLPAPALGRFASVTGPRRSPCRG